MHYALMLAAILGQSAPVAAPVATQPTQSELASHDVLAPIKVIPVRHLRKNILSAEFGWNSLSGVGVMYSRNLNAHIALDGSVGISARGGQAGVRGRYNILNRNVTPFVGVGFMYGTGFPDALEAKKDNNDLRFAYRIDRSPFVQGVAGVSWQTRHGLSLMGMAGFNQLLRDGNVKVIAGSATPSDQDNLKKVFSSGPTLAMNIGYAF
jgi:acylphosphatase